MNATVGDHIVIQGHHVGDPSRRGEILETRGSGGEPPWLIRWEGNGHEGLLYPGSDAVVEIHAGKDHRTLLSPELRDRIRREMAETAAEATKEKIGGEADRGPQ